LESKLSLLVSGARTQDSNAGGLVCLHDVPYCVLESGAIFYLFM